MLLSVIGSYAIRNSMLDVWIALLFGILGYFCNRVKLDTGAMALGIILGPMVEENFGKCVSLSNVPGSSVMQVFLDSPIALALIFLTLLSLCTPFFMRLRRRRAAAEAGLPAQPDPANRADWLKDMLSGLFVLLIAAVFCTQMYELEDVGRNYALLLLAFIVLMGLWLCFQGFGKRRRLAGGPGAGEEEPVAIRRVAVIVAASAAYVALVPILGVYPASALFLCLSAVVLNDSGRSPYIAACLLTLIMCLAVWLVFSVLLGVPTPEGALFQ